MTLCSCTLLIIQMAMGGTTWCIFAMTLCYQASTSNKGIIIIVWFIMTFTVLDYMTAEMSSMRGEIQCTLVMHR